MSGRDGVKEQVRQAFAGVAYPGDGCLVNSREGSEPALLEKEFKGRSDWRALDAGFIDRAPDGFGTALSFFSDEAFRFYLPAYLLADLDGRLQQADPVFALTHGLESGSREQKINPRRYGERTWLDRARHKFAMFNASEAAAIAAYLRYRLAGAEMEYERSPIREALESYWERRAHGPIMAPRELVRAWVETFNRADAEGLADFYAEEATNHQVAEVPVVGREAIREMFAREFARARMVCLVENIFEDGEWGILEWRDPLGLRGCGFFRIVDGKIALQRGYWDKLSFLRMHGLPIPHE
jgi:hypothetical protein